MQTHALSQPQSLELASVELTVLEGPDRGKTLRVGEACARIGTSPGSQLQLSDPTVSRVHCEVELRSEGVRIADNGSTNGTFIDGVRIRAAYLSSGATIRIGATSLRAQFGDE